MCFGFAMRFRGWLRAPQEVIAHKVCTSKSKSEFGLKDGKGIRRTFEYSVRSQPLQRRRSSTRFRSPYVLVSSTTAESFSFSPPILSPNLACFSDRSLLITNLLHWSVMKFSFSAPPYVKESIVQVGPGNGQELLEQIDDAALRPCRHFSCEVILVLEKHCNLCIHSQCSFQTNGSDPEEEFLLSWRTFKMIASTLVHGFGQTIREAW